jgi:hypothetical protein
VTIRQSLLLLMTLGATPLVEGIARGGAILPRPGDQLQAALAPATEKSPLLRWTSRKPDGTDAAVEVVGAEPAALAVIEKSEMTIDRWTSLLSVHVIPDQPAATTATLPILGKYRVLGAVIRFEPRFPLEPGMRYQAEFDPAGLHAVTQALTRSKGAATGKPRTTIKLIAEYSPPRKPVRSSTQVAAVYPTRDLLPENLLRFYVSFSAPMSRGEAYLRIKLLDALTGKPVDAPFLELDEELWSNDAARFTLLFDPGRIKRGLKPREEVGPILEEASRIPWSSIATGSMRRGIRSRPGIARPFGLGHPMLPRPTRRPGRSIAPRPARAIPWRFASPNHSTGRCLIASSPFKTGRRGSCRERSCWAGRRRAGDSRRGARGEQETIRWWLGPSSRT